MKNGMIRGLITGMIIGGMGATVFGIRNWKTEREWNRQIRQGGEWLSEKADGIMKKF